jgi:hypothetical protein
VIVSVGVQASFACRLGRWGRSRGGGYSQQGERWALRGIFPRCKDFQVMWPGSFPCWQSMPTRFPAMATAGRGVRPPTARPIKYQDSLPLPLVWQGPERGRGD